MDQEELWEYRKYWWIVLLIICIVSFFNRSNLHSVTTIEPETLKQPIQTELYKAKPVCFQRDGYTYDLTPLYQYDISGLVVGAFNYKNFSSEKFERVFPLDVCLIWGNNLQRRVHLNPGVHFSQDCRWCWVNWSGPVDFNLQELSNNHLIIKDDRVWQIAKQLMRGDQVHITGKLVNAVIKPLSGAGSPIPWNTSLIRSDSGAGACEIILVEDIRVLRTANGVARFLFGVSFWVLVILLCWRFVALFRPTLPKQ